MKLSLSSPEKRGASNHVMDYTELSERLRKTLYYGILPKLECSSLSLTNVIVEKFGENDELFLERLCFDFAADLSREACLSPCSLVLAMIYLDRLRKKNPNYVSSIPSSKLFLISVMVASKFLNDEGEEDEVFNTDWANSAKMDIKELNKLEREFLLAIDWSLFVDEEDFSETLLQIECKVARQESLKRGWLTYTDVNTLAQHKLMVDSWRLVVDYLVNVSVTCMAAYLASFATLFGSALVATNLPWNTNYSPVPVVMSPILNSQANSIVVLPNQNNQDVETNIETMISNGTSLPNHIFFYKVPVEHPNSTDSPFVMSNSYHSPGHFSNHQAQPEPKSFQLAKRERKRSRWNPNSCLGLDPGVHLSHILSCIAA
uniref:Protein CNPPD1 n=1 Tax=Evadne anonyx TaxID=141404 RepID=A0A9N6ZFA9_9CRUS|nr:EOG090X069C [Evadne anonyx]